MLATILLALGQTFVTVPLQTPPYSTGHPVAINDTGTAAGWVSTLGTPYAAHWGTSGAITFLGRTGTQVTAINDDGHTSGFAFTYIKTIPLLDQKPLPFGSNATALDLNNRGDVLLQITGATTTAGLLLLRGGLQVDFSPNVFVHDLTDNRLVTGQRNGLAFRWGHGSFQDLLPAPGHTSSYGVAINEAGAVVGVSDTSPCLWLQNQPQLLPDYPSASPTAINNQGWIVGYGGGKAILWINSVPQELPLASAFDVNSNGQIVGLSAAGLPVRLDPL